MQAADTDAAREYQAVTRAVDWANIDLAHEIVAIEALVERMRQFKGTDAVFIFASPSPPERVSEVLTRLDARLMNKRHALLQRVGGKECDLRREILKVQMSGYPLLP